MTDGYLDRIFNDMESVEWDLEDYAINRREYERERDKHVRKEAGVGWSFLADLIVSTYRRKSFMGAIIYGRQGVGKSVYSIKVAYDALRRLGFLPKHATTRDVFKRYMVFSAKSLIGVIKSAKGSRVPVLIWDDAGVHGGAYLFFTDVALAKAVADVFQVIRTRVSSLLFTVPNPRSILRPIRSQDIILIHVQDLDGRHSVAKIYSLILLPNMVLRVYKLAEEVFLKYLKTYTDYEKIRDSYIDEALAKLEEQLQEAELKKLAKRRKLEEEAGRGGLW